jgi:hypothetical protein
MVRREWLDAVGFFDEEFSHHSYGSEDWDIWLRLSYKGCLMDWIKDILCQYRTHPGSMVHNANRQRDGMLYVLEKFFNQPDLPQNLHEKRNDVVSNALLRSSARLYAGENFQSAIQGVDQAIELTPNLMDNHGEGLFQALMGWINDPIVENPDCFVKNIYSHLPASASDLKKRKHKALGLLARSNFFKGTNHSNWKLVKSSTWQIITNDPVLLLNRGIASGLYKLVKHMIFR